MVKEDSTELGLDLDRPGSGSMSESFRERVRFWVRESVRIKVRVS